MPGPKLTIIRSYCEYFIQKGGSSSNNSSNNGTSDVVDFTLCFEDTAILYGVCMVVWILAGFSFICASYHRRGIRISLLHLAKIVSILIFYRSTTNILSYIILLTVYMNNKNDV